MSTVLTLSSYQMLMQTNQSKLQAFNETIPKF